MRAPPHTSRILPDQPRINPNALTAHSYRNNTRFVLKSEALAAEMFARLESFLPSVVTPAQAGEVFPDEEKKESPKQQPQQPDNEDAKDEEGNQGQENPDEKPDEKLNEKPEEKPEEQLEEQAADPKGKDWKLVGLNPHYRFCKYDRGGVFKRHLDGNVVHDRLRHRSWYTCMLYLNSIRDGGATRFFDREKRPAAKWWSKLAFWSSGDKAPAVQAQEPLDRMDDWSKDDDDTVRGIPDLRWVTTVSVPPGPGQILVFFPDQWHDGERVRSDDLKYIVRTEVMFKR